MNDGFAIQWTLRGGRAQVYWFTQAFGPEELERIGELVAGLPAQEGWADGAERPELRRSTIVWIPANPDSEWLYKKIVDIVLHVNAINFNLNLSGIETLQHTTYGAAVQGFYGTHSDVFSAARQGLNRKLSFSIQLAEPDDYTGGDLVIEGVGQKIEAPRNAGAITFFDSHAMHHVTPVTQGVRTALVGWVCGPELI